MTDFVYDKIFRYFYGSSNLFVVERNGKKGLLDDCTGEVVVPCEMDEFYEQMDTDGIIPYNQGKKWGMVHFGVSTGAVFNDIDIRSEMSAKAKVGDEWFFVDGEGNLQKMNMKHGSGPGMMQISRLSNKKGEVIGLSVCIINHL